MDPLLVFRILSIWGPERRLARLGALTFKKHPGEILPSDAEGLAFGLLDVKQPVRQPNLPTTATKAHQRDPTSNTSHSTQLKPNTRMHKSHNSTNATIQILKPWAHALIPAFWRLVRSPVGDVQLGQFLTFPSRGFEAEDLPVEGQPDARARVSSERASEEKLPSVAILGAFCCLQVAVYGFNRQAASTW